MKARVLLVIVAIVATGTMLAVVGQRDVKVKASPPPNDEIFDGKKVVKTEAEWKTLLGPAAFHVMREKGTERAYTGKLTDNHASGIYACAACGLHLFSSKHKFDSGTGWPSFWQPIEPGRIAERSDTTLGMVRTEVHCARCDGHQGHVFDDGPRPTGLRYCINSVSIAFVPRS